MIRRSSLGCLCLLACEAAEDVAPAPAPVTLLASEEVFPARLPPDAPADNALNNLDVTEHDGRVFVAYRTSQSHFASPATRMVVVSSEDEQTWRLEGVFSLDTDLREPQLVSADGELWLWFAELGRSSLDFEPAGTWRARYLDVGAWTEPERWGPDGFIPWRIKWMDGRWHLLGYTGGEGIYDAGADPVRVRWYTSDDAVSWTPAVGEDPVVLEGGGSETDLVLLDDGSLVAVVRNEAGDADGFGSKVCTAPAGDLGAWACAHDPRKYDSPLVLRAAGRVWLIARRNVTDDGLFDLGRDDLPFEEQYLTYQATYWGQPKRCAVWSVDPAARAVRWELDLPSRGDTCFPEALDRGDGRVVVYNYSNDPDGPDLPWLQGQSAKTNIYRHELRFADVEADSP